MSTKQDFYCREHCIHYSACLWNSEYTPTPCKQFKDKADVVEIRHGFWVKQKRNPEVMKAFHEMGLGNGMSINSIYWTCSICENWGTPNHKYCCSCGAKMDGERKENDL